MIHHLKTLYQIKHCIQLLYQYLIWKYLKNIKFNIYLKCSTTLFLNMQINCYKIILFSCYTNHLVTSLIKFIEYYIYDCDKKSIVINSLLLYLIQLYILILNIILTNYSAFETKRNLI